MVKKYKCEFSDLECSIIMQQIARRAQYRKEFLRAKTDPCKHSQEAGYVFDPWIQRFTSMKCTQLYLFKPTFGNSLFGICTIILPMVAYGTAVYFQRAEREQLIRCGKIKPKDRIHKFA